MYAQGVMAVALIIVGAALLVATLTALVWQRVRFIRRMRHYEARWEAVKQGSRSRDPAVRRAAAKQALRLIKRRPE